MTWRPWKHRFAYFLLICCTLKQKHRFCWLSVSYHLETDDLNIWSEIEMMNCHLYLISRSESETAAVWEYLHKNLAAAAYHVPEGKKSSIFFLLWRGMLGLQTFGTNFGYANAGCPIINQDQWRASLSELHDLYSKMKARCCPLVRFFPGNLNGR